MCCDRERGVCCQCTEFVNVCVCVMHCMCMSLCTVRIIHSVQRLFNESSEKCVARTLRHQISLDYIPSHFVSRAHTHTESFDYSIQLRWALIFVNIIFFIVSMLCTYFLNPRTKTRPSKKSNNNNKSYSFRYGFSFNILLYKHISLPYFVAHSL